MKWFYNTALTLVIVGAINWLLIGIFQFDIVAFLFGELSFLSRAVYTIIGLCGLYLISLYGGLKKCKEQKKGGLLPPFTYSETALSILFIFSYTRGFVSAPITIET